MDLARAPRRPPLTARKKGSGYENGPQVQITDLGNLVPRLLPSHAIKLRKDPGWGWSRDTPESGVFSISVLREDVHKNQT